MSLAALFLAGCAPGFLDVGKERLVEVPHVAATFDPGERALFRLELSVLNPGRSSAQLRSIRWEAWLSDRWFAAGEEKLEVTLPPGKWSYVPLDLPVAFTRTGEPDAAPKVVRLGMRGTLTVHWRSGDQELPFSRIEEQKLAYLPTHEEKSAP